MKKIFSIFLVTLMILNSAGYVIVYFQLKSTFQKDALLKLESNINNEDLTTIILSNYEFENESEDYHFVEPKEIMYFGKMYDIFRIEYYKDSVKFLALSDEKEDILINLFELFFTKNLNDEYSGTSNLLKLIITDSGLPVEFNGIPSWREDVCYSFIFVPLLKNIIEIPSPPPKYFS